MSESIGLTTEELIQIQEELKNSLTEQIDKLIGDMQNQTINDGFDLEKREMVPQGVDPKRGWNFRGVHKVYSS